ncbi:winged helix-turn-helix domain-containing protein [Niveispirillum sp. KHB5.9]|uniref:winged helix-turn-helix domain-containing protein n=1 Tax=Niveispirillum sp. KHB5.9 TaxID=3400269 RepID=UPI003A887E86
MDSYLNIAETVLRFARRPLTAREILELAYTSEIVPSQLHGRTQHKTIGARLSEDILLHRERSVFFRTEPGRFFLREFLTDTSLPERFRTPMIARRRARELQRGTALAFSPQALDKFKGSALTRDSVLPLLQSNEIHYTSDVNHRDNDEIVVWSFVMVVRDDCVLTYRHGRYREGRDAFLKRRSLGFFAPIIDKDLDLFGRHDHGIISSGLKIITIDLDLPSEITFRDGNDLDSDIDYFLLYKEENKPRDLLAIIRFECPEWFDPVSRRLAINDLNWMNLRNPVNHIEDFDPWSQSVLQHAQKASS